MTRFALKGTPTLIVIDRAGRVRAVVFGQVDDLGLGALFGRLIDEESPSTNEKDL